MELTEAIKVGAALVGGFAFTIWWTFSKAEV